MNYISTSLVTDQPPTVRVNDAGTEAIRFGTESAVSTVCFPIGMSPDAKAAWCLGFAKDLTDLAAQIMQDATVTA